AMKMIYLAIGGILGSLFLLAGAAVGFFGAEPPSRARLDMLLGQGNYKEAYEGFRALALDPQDDPRLVGTGLQEAGAGLAQLGRGDEVDDFREAVVRVHKDNWRLLQVAADSYLTDPWHFGFIVAGKFHRGQHRGGGRYVVVQEPDRARAVQLLAQGVE